jgi:hypothetical protein
MLRMSRVECSTRPNGVAVRVIVAASELMDIVEAFESPP